jgi:hypothetical protein
MSAVKRNRDAGLDPHPRPAGVRGRPFQKGNGGRRTGSKNRTTPVAEALLKGEEVELVRSGIERAKAGDTQMLKFFLERILPKDRSVRLAIPEMKRAGDAVNALGAIIDAVADGQIAPSEAASLATLVASYVRTMSVYDLEDRLDKIERDLSGLKSS